MATDGRGGLTPVDVPGPDIVSGGALVHVSACGFCGSDLEKVRDASLPRGTVLGHEVVGRVKELGPGVTARDEAGGLGAYSSDGRGVGPGSRVAVAHHVPCGVCSQCRRGHSSLCRRFRETGLVPGGLAEELVVGPYHLADAVFVLPDSVSDAAGTLVEPLSCVLRALDVAGGLLHSYPGPSVAGIPGAAAGGAGGSAGAAGSGAARVSADSADNEGVHVTVAGCGSVGLLFLAVLSAAEALGPAAGELRPSVLTYSEPAEERASLAERLGASSVDASASAVDVAVDVAIVTAPKAFSDMVRRVRPGGVVIVFAAGDGAARTAVDLDVVYRREITIAGVRSGSPGHLRRAVDVLGTGLLPLEWFEPVEVGLGELPRAVERYAAGEVLKVVARP